MKEIGKELLNLLGSNFKIYTQFLEVWAKVMKRFLNFSKIKKYENSILFVEIFDIRFLQELNLSSSIIIDNLKKEGLKNFHIEKIIFTYGKKNKSKKELKIKNIEYTEKDNVEIHNAKEHLSNLNFKDSSITDSLLNIYKKIN